MPGCAETQYIFDSSFELGYITADVYDWLYGLDFNLDRIIDYSNGEITINQLRDELHAVNVRDVFYDDSITHDIQTIVTDYFDLNYDHMPLVEKCYYDLILLFGSNEQPYGIKSQLAKRITDCYYNNSYHPPIKLITSEEKLNDPDLYREVMRKDLTVSTWIARMKSRRAIAIENLKSVNVDELRNFVVNRRQEFERRIRQRVEMITINSLIGDDEVWVDGDTETMIDREIDRMDQGFNFSENTTQLSYTPKVRKKKLVLSKKQRKTARRAIIKGIDLFSKFFDRKDIEGFIKGYEYTIEGEKFNYRLTKSDRTSILRHTLSPTNVHIPYDLEITDKNNIVLAKACYLFEMTPIIDQIIAFTMMIKSGNEDEFIKKANMFSTTEHYRGSELAEMKQSFRRSPNSISNEDYSDLIDQINVVEREFTHIYDRTHGQYIWRNRIEDSLDSIMAAEIGISVDEWYRWANPNENFGAMSANPQLIGSQIRLLT